MSINPTATQPLYTNYNVGDFSASTPDPDEAAFDAALEKLRIEAEQERTTNDMARRVARQKRQENWLHSHPRLNQMIAGGIISEDKGTQATMQPSYEHRGTSFDSFDAVSPDDTLLNTALGLSQPAEAYGGHPEEFLDAKRMETEGAHQAAYDALAAAPSPEHMQASLIQEAQRISASITISRQAAEGRIPPNNYQSDFELAA